MKRHTSNAVRLRAGLLTLLMGGLAVVAYVRGTRSSTVEDNPSSSKEGVRCKLFDDGNGHKPVRCAAVVDAAPADVSAIVRDYAHFPDVFQTSWAKIRVTSATPDEGGVVHFVGNLDTVFKTLPIDVKIKHTDEGDTHTASWDDAHGALLMDRGSWTVKPAPGGGSLLVYQLEIRAPLSPDFAVNNILLAKMGDAVEHVRKRAATLKGASGT